MMEINMSREDMQDIIINFIEERFNVKIDGLKFMKERDYESDGEICESFDYVTLLVNKDQECKKDELNNRNMTEDASGFDSKESLKEGSDKTLPSDSDIKDEIKKKEEEQGGIQ